jgi:hypothetical protein
VWFAGIFAWHGDPINYTEYINKLRINQLLYGVI